MCGSSTESRGRMGSHIYTHTCIYIYVCMCMCMCARMYLEVGGHLVAVVHQAVERLEDEGGGHEAVVVELPQQPGQGQVPLCVCVLVVRWVGSKTDARGREGRKKHAPLNRTKACVRRTYVPVCPAPLRRPPPPCPAGSPPARGPRGAPPASVLPRFTYVLCGWMHGGQWMQAARQYRRGPHSTL